MLFYVQFVVGFVQVIVFVEVELVEVCSQVWIGFGFVVVDVVVFVYVQFGLVFIVVVMVVMLLVWYFIV